MVRRFAHRRLAAQIVFDSGAWAAGLTLATLLRYDLSLRGVDLLGLAMIIPLAALSQVVAGLGVGLYLGRWRFASFDEVAALAKAGAITTALLFALDLWVSNPRMVPLSATIGGGAIALVLMGGARYAWRLAAETMRRPADDGAARTLVLGAGEGGAQVITAMLRDPTSPYLPVGIVDDDPAKRNLRISGVRVVGDRRQLADAAQRLRADAILVAIPSAGSRLISEVTDEAQRCGLDVKVLPPVAELFGSGVGLADVRDVTVADLLGRHEVETDLAAIAGYLTGRRVLVTGAGGSIGSELCRQIHRFAPAELVMLDRDESALHAVELSIEGRALLDSPGLVLCDIRDAPALREVFSQRRPEVVFHAAALKHLPLLEQHPAEAVKSNLWGTLHVLDAAAGAGVERFVNISTDKAADPSSVLGYSKRIAERLTAWYGGRAPGTYLSVRFGNVLGSRGSVLDTFHAQVAAGGPITVTDPEVTRYFMTVSEAVQLVIQAGAIGGDGEALVLDMGEPVCIDDVARRLAGQAPRPVKIVYTGLRAGEKLHETLLGCHEVDRRPAHPLITHVPVPAISADAVRSVDPTAPPECLVATLRRLCDEAGTAASMAEVRAEGDGAVSMVELRSPRRADDDAAAR